VPTPGCERSLVVVWPPCRLLRLAGAGGDEVDFLATHRFAGCRGRRRVCGGGRGELLVQQPKPTRRGLTLDALPTL